MIGDRRIELPSGIRHIEREFRGGPWDHQVHEVRCDATAIDLGQKSRWHYELLNQRFYWAPPTTATKFAKDRITKLARSIFGVDYV